MTTPATQRSIPPLSEEEQRSIDAANVRRDALRPQLPAILEHARREGRPERPARACLLNRLEIRAGASSSCGLGDHVGLGAQLVEVEALREFPEHGDRRHESDGR